MQNNTKQVLLYNVTDENYRKLRKFFRGLGVSSVKVRSSEYAQPIGYIAGLPGYAMAEGFNMGGNFHEEMMVMQGLSSGDVDMTLEFFRQGEVPAIDLKAVVTPVNASWNSLELHDELVRERDALG